MDHVSDSGSPVNDMQYVSRRPREEGHRFFGAIDFVDPAGGVRGWAYDAKNLSRPLLIQIRCEGELVAESYALLDRPDLDAVIGEQTRSSLFVGWSRFDRKLCRKIALRSPRARIGCWIPDAKAWIQFVVTAPTISEVTRRAGEAGANERRPEFKLLNDYLDIREAGVFDAAWYSRTQIATSVPDALLHFLTEGENFGLAPNLLFDPAYYAEQRGTKLTAGGLLHYLRTGERLGLAPSPHFDPVWYRAAQTLDADANALGHWLAHRRTAGPNAWFDPAAYRSRNPEVERLADPYEHYISVGAVQGLSASDAFNAKAYREAYLSAELDANPFLHFLWEGRGLDLSPRPDLELGTEAAAHDTMTSAAALPLPQMATAEGEEVKVVAFYLPQFHPIPENDAAWGEGFTEWTNVTKTKPLFEGHHQPQLPAEIGFYDLRLPQVMEQQAALAKGHGIHGFCFYAYWFDGRRLLEKPLEQMLASGKPDMPFCLAWANENWTRRWDGSDQEIIVAQTFAPEFRTQIIDDFMPYFRDPRYIRVDGKPVFIVYRPDIVPDLRETLALWRRHAAEQGVELYLVGCLTFGFDNPLGVGFDAGLEFPPHGLAAPNATDSVSWAEPFSGAAFRYDDVVEREVIRPERPFPLIRTCMAGWDNTARRGSRAHIFLDSSPEKFATWLSALVHRTRLMDPPGRRLVFVNAWNEWAEGAHLEPDNKFGRQWLMAVARAVRDPGGEAAADLEQGQLAAITAAAGSPTAPAELRLAHQVLTRTRAKLARSEAVSRALGIHYASRLRDERWSEARAPAPASWLKELNFAPLDEGVLGWVENPGPSRITTDRREPLYLSGWLLDPSVGGPPRAPVAVSLTPTTGTAMPAVILAHYGRSRPDLLTYGDLAKLNGAAHAGFDVYADLRTLPSGRYRLRVGVSSERGTAYTPFVRDLVLT